MAMPSGSRLGPYEILALLGAGGMGEVYRARDPRLGREVAVKVLPAERLADESRRRRFVQEARAASTLNHPNIVTIHEIEREGDADFIVMELVTGKSLDKLIPSGGMPLAEALRLAIPIADAVSRAHAAGIVHRDLKPANVVVSQEGVPKVLDFGLAKLLSRDDVNEADTLTEATATSPLSQPGAISGTPAYMSPEQATGKRVDARSDVFSFGSLLYEMVTGRRAFLGTSRAETLEAVVSSEPTPPSAIVPGVPTELEKLILRCLRKDPERRFRDVADLRLELEDIRQESSSRRGAATRREGRLETRKDLRVIGFLALVVAMAGLAAFAWRWRMPGARQPTGTLTQVTRGSGLTTDAAVSAAANLLAYASDRGRDGQLDLWVQPFPQGEPIRLTQSAEDEREPSFSPDGSRIAFRSDRDGGGIYVASALGGVETRIADKGRAPRFSPDGRWIAYFVGDTVLSGGSVFVVPAAGGVPRQLGDNSLHARLPLWTPDGRFVLCLAFPGGNAAGTWIALAVEGGQVVETDAVKALAGGQWPSRVLGYPAAWTSDGEHVLYSAPAGDSTNIWSLGLSPKTWRVTEPPRQVTFGTGIVEKPAVAGGRLLFTSAVADVDLWSLAPGAGGAPHAELRRLTTAPGPDHWPSISAEGKRIAFLSERSGVRSVWMSDSVLEREIPVTAGQAGVAYPRISADGSRVAYLVRAEGGTPAPPRSAASTSAPPGALPAFQRGSLFVVAIDSAGRVGVPRRVCDDCGRPWDWTRDGRHLVQRGDGATLLRDVESGEAVPLSRNPTIASSDPRLSPDDRWISFTSHTSPITRRIFIAPFEGAVPIPDAAWIPVSDGGHLDRSAAWDPGSERLYYHSDRDGFFCLWAQRLEPRTKRPLGEPYALRHLHAARPSMATAMPDPGAISISTGGDRLVFALGEMTGNIWSIPY